jgi:hypothetical protein
MVQIMARVEILLFTAAMPTLAVGTAQNSKHSILQGNPAEASGSLLKLTVGRATSPLYTETTLCLYLMERDCEDGRWMELPQDRV